MLASYVVDWYAEIRLGIMGVILQVRPRRFLEVMAKKLQLVVLSLLGLAIQLDVGS